MVISYSKWHNKMHLLSQHSTYSFLTFIFETLCFGTNVNLCKQNTTYANILFLNVVELKALSSLAIYRLDG